MLLGQTPATVALWRRGEPIPDADVYWLTVTDAAIPVLAAQLPPDRVVLHAAGVLPAAVLHHPLGGVLHPLMSFPGPEVAIPSLNGVPARVDGPPAARAAARQIAAWLGLSPVEDVDPIAWHAAACMVSGHLAALYLDAVAVLERAGRPDAAALLLPLARESLNRAATAGQAAITGPAARGDDATVEAHRTRLGPEREAYDALDRRIRERLGR